MTAENKSHRAKRITYALLTASAALAFATPLGGRGAPFVPQGQIQKAGVDDSLDDGLFQSGGVIAVRNHSGASNSDWLRLETNGCGLPERVENRRSVVTRSAFDDDADDDDELDDLGPVDEAWALIAKSLSHHPEIATITDGVVKSCDDDALDEDFTSDLIAGWSARPAPLLRPAASYIA